MRSNATSSSSATIWRSAVETPVPNSTLPLNTVIDPSAATTSHESTWFAAGASRESELAASRILTRDNEKPTARIPVDLRKSRRVTAVIPSMASDLLLLIRASLPGTALSDAQLGRALDGADDSHVRSAATEVGVERAPNLLPSWLLVARDEGGRRHDHPVRAVATLRGLRFDESLLHRMRLRSGAETFDRRDGSLCRSGERRRTGAYSASVDVDHTRAALPKSAAELRSGEAEVVAEDVEKRRIRRGGHVVRGAVDDDACNLGSHD